MPLIDHFGLLAPYYDRIIKINGPEKWIERAKLPVDGQLLDAGGGTGRISGVLLGMAKGLFVADLSQKMLLQASAKYGLNTVCTHTEKLPFPDGHFDRIIMADALHHVCDHKQTANELWRVLKPGGRLVIEEPDVRKLSIKLVAIAEKVAMMRSHFISPLKIETLFPYPNAKTAVETEGYNAWVLVDKNPQ